MSDYWPVIHVSDQEFEEMAAGFSKPHVPTPSIVRGAELLEKLYGKRRPVNVGWQCPVCGLGNAPHASKCWHCDDARRRKEAQERQP